MKQKCSNGGSVPSTHTHRNAGFQRNFLVIMMLVALMLKVDVGWGQGNPSQICPNNLLENPDFAFSGVDDGYDAFCQGFVNNWRGLDFTPHIIQLDPLGNTDCDIVISDASNTMACLRSGPADQIAITESIAQQGLTFSPDPLVTYFIDISARLLDCGRLNSFTNLHVYLLNSNEFPQGCANPSAGWTPVVSQQIVNSQVNWYNTQNVFENFSIANPTFNAIYIRSWKPYPPTEINQTVLGLENVVLACQTTALTDLTVNNTSGLSYAFGSVNSSTISTFTDYLWTFTKNCNSQIVFQSTNSNPSYTFTEGGQYEICLDIRDNFGCCATRCENLNVPCSPPMSVFTSEVSCVNNENIVSFTQSSGSCLSYLWNFGDNSTSTTQNPIHEYINNGTYTVTLTVTDACGQSASSTQNVVVNCRELGSRCDEYAADLTYLTIDCGSSPVLWSQYAAANNLNVNNINAEKVYFKGTLIVDVPLLIYKNLTPNVQWIMDEGSQIIVNSIFDNQKVHYEACNKMWKGIKVESGLLILHSSILQDAEYGVQLLSGNANLTATKFINNFIGYRTFKTSLSLQNCEFRSTGVLKPPYFGQMGYPSDGYTYAGIKIENAGSFSVGLQVGNNTNFFDGVRNGIVSINTNTNVYNATFSNMRGASEDINATSQNMSGYAIIASGGSIYNIANNNISGANIGVSINNATVSNIKIRNNNISNFNNAGEFGINCKNNYGGNIEAFSNTITNGYNSIDFANNNGSGNKIYSNTITNNQVFEGAKEISLSCTSCNENTTSIHNNNIVTSKASFGIASLLAKKNQIYGNNVNLTATHPQEGILVSNALESNLTNNFVQGSNLQGRGFQIFQSPTSYMFCNRADNLQTGFYFHGMSPSTNFRSNLMNEQLSNGLELSSTLIGVQSHKSNVWYGTNRQARLINSSLSFNQFIIDPILSAPTIPGLVNGTFKPTANPVTWFLQQLGFEFTCWDNAFFVEEEPDLNGRLASMIAGEGSENAYEDYNRWFLAKEAYTYIDQHLGDITDNDLLGFYSAADQSLTKISEVESLVRSSFLPTTSETNEMQAITSLIELKSSEITNIVADPNYEGTPSMVSQVALLRSELDSLHGQLATIQDQQKLRFTEDATILRALIYELPRETEFLSDYRDVLLAWVDYYLQGGGYVIDHHLAAIQPIADKCILNNGEAVTLARHVLHTLSLPVDYSDHCDPAQDKTSLKEVVTDEIKLMPNPASTLIWIENTGTLGVKQVQSMTSDGQIYHTTFDGGEIQFIDIKDWPAGLFLLKITLSNGQELYKKIIKI